MNITLILNSDKNYHLNQYMRFMNLWGNTCVFLPCKRCVVKNVDSGLNGLVQIPAPITNNGLLEKKITETSWASVSSLNGRIRKRVLLRISSEKKNCSLAGVAQWIDHGLWTKGSLVLFPVRAHAWVAGQVPSRGCMRGSHTLMFLSLSPSLPLSLKINK